VKLLDANLLLYAYNADAPQHSRARQWMEKLFASPEWVGIPWLTLWAFVRISTNPRLTPVPLPAGDAFHIVRTLLAHPRVTVLEPGPRHAQILEQLAVQNQATGPLLTDAVLAALAVEHGGTLASADRGFARFAQLRWFNPLEPA
jgi:toxin-antitoxin system PIN domain toxin